MSQALPASIRPSVGVSIAVGIHKNGLTDSMGTLFFSNSGQMMIEDSTTTPGYFSAGTIGAGLNMAQTQMMYILTGH